MSSVVYFIRCPVRGIKIGTTDNFDYRFKDLKAKYGADLAMLGWLDGSKALEGRMHKRFAELRTDGEWFTPSPSLELFVQDRIIQGTPPGAEQDASTKLAAKWAAYLRERVSVETGGDRDTVLDLIGERIGVQGGTLRHIIWGRTLAVDVDTFTKLRNAAVDVMHEHLRALNNDLDEAELFNEQGIRVEHVTQAQTILARAQALYAATLGVKA